MSLDISGVTLNDSVEFGTLKVGECFEYMGRVYQKQHCLVHEYTPFAAYCFEYARSVSFVDTIRVHPMKLKLTNG